jgi:hypothetical protein
MAEEKKGTAPSWSVCAVWDYAHSINALLLRYVWRDRVGWADLKTRVPDVLATWRCSKAYIENAHHGPALRDEIRGISAELIGPTIPGMTESHRGAKLERAIASGLLSRLEDGRLLIPREESPWVRTYINEMVGWGGLPNEPADQVDVSSYAAHVVKRQVANWGGPINSGGMKRG